MKKILQLREIKTTINWCEVQNAKDAEGVYHRFSKLLA